mgnify:CR=1 FL=1
MATLKEQKEAFVSGHEGTSPQEILLVCLSGIVGYWLFSVLPVHVTSVRILSSEVYLFWLPMILLQSNFLYPWGVLYLIVEVILALVLEVQLSRQKENEEEEDAKTAASTTAPQSTTQHQHGALTMHRSVVMYLTFVAILAVDFPLFPRRFVKTETGGYSLMDVGAASFAIVGGLASPRARLGRSRSLFKEVKRMAPLVFMGSLRLLTHQEIDYQEHVSEYGVHWNFFYTLAALGPMTAVLPGPTWIVPTSIMVLYQYFLSNMALQSFMEDAPRRCTEQESSSWMCDLFMANREGVLGCCGYVSLYLISEWIGGRVLWSNSTANDTVRQMLCASGAVLLLWRVGVAIGIPVSRRSTNLGFVLWSLVVNLTLSTCILIIYKRHQRVTFLSNLVNRHGLACFIVANLLTGLVNISINTLEVQNLTAVAILLAYLTTVGLFVMLLDGVWTSLSKHKQA